MSRLLNIALIFVATFLGITACSDNSCNDNGSSLPLAVFFSGGTQQTITGLTVKGIDAPGDSLLANSASLNELYLPLRAPTTTTSFEISRPGTDEATLTDTITIDYRPIEFFHSIECGAMFNFDIKRAQCTNHGIDSIVVLTPLVTNSRIPALRLYFKQ